MIGIYSITHVESGRKYIGASTDIEVRWKQHIRKVSKGNGSYIHKSIAQYGFDSFLFKVEIECKTKPVDKAAGHRVAPVKEGK